LDSKDRNTSVPLLVPPASRKDRAAGGSEGGGLALKHKGFSQRRKVAKKTLLIWFYFALLREKLWRFGQASSSFPCDQPFRRWKKRCFRRFPGLALSTRARCSGVSVDRNFARVSARTDRSCPRSWPCWLESCWICPWSLALIAAARASRFFFNCCRIGSAFCLDCSNRVLACCFCDSLRSSRFIIRRAGRALRAGVSGEGAGACAKAMAPASSARVETRVAIRFIKVCISLIGINPAGLEGLLLS